MTEGRRSPVHATRSREETLRGNSGETSCASSGPATELDDRDEAQQVFVIGSCQARELELLPRLVEPSGIEALPGPPQVKKENRLVER